jgi:hypothetical protein
MTPALPTKVPVDARIRIQESEFWRFRRGQGQGFLLLTPLTPFFGGSNFQLKSD